MRLLALFLALARLAAALRPAGAESLDREAKHGRRLTMTQLQGVYLMDHMTVLRDKLDVLVQAEALDEEGQNATDLLRELVDARNNATAALLELQNATALLELQNATEHLSDEGESHLALVAPLMIVIYKSMDKSHEVEQERLNFAATEIQGCNDVTEERLSEHGDIWHLEWEARDYQDKLNNARDSIHELNFTNHSKWEELFYYLKFLPAVPECPEGYDRKTPADIGDFVNSDDYLDQLERQRQWYEEIEVNFELHYNECEGAHQALTNGNLDVDVARAKLGAEWCIWHVILVAGCEQHDVCYDRQVAHLMDMIEHAKVNMQTRKDAYIAGEHVVAHIAYLLAHTDAAEEEIDVDTSRYDLVWPPVPDKGPCDVLGFITQPHWEDDLDCPNEGFAAPATPYPHEEEEDEFATWRAAHQ